MFGFHIEANKGLLVFPALFIGYTLTDQILQLLQLGVSTQLEFNVLEYQVVVFWQIGKILKDK
jgi:hypothetical protein